MAAIWVDKKCAKCRKPIGDGDKAVLVATVKTTKASAYGNYSGGGASQVRVNFFSGSDRKLLHLECAGE